MKILVFGSCNIDLVYSVKSIVRPGETLAVGELNQFPGGKGFNQGVAAHKSGGDVTMITKLGKDTFAEIALGTMRELGMDTSRVIQTEEYATGVALIEVDENSGQNAIMVIPSACDRISDAEVAALKEVIEGADILLTQLETNMSSIKGVIDMAHAAGKTIILNTAPVQPVEDALLSKVTIVTPNEVEASILTGVKVVDEQSAAQAADWFFQRGVKKVVITMGGMGAYVADGTRAELTPAFRVNAIDTTGAGDAYNGGFVTALSEGNDIFAAARFAAATAALSVQKMGTTPSMPTREEIEAFLKEH